MELYSLTRCLISDCKTSKFSFNQIKIKTLLLLSLREIKSPFFGPTLLDISIKSGSDKFLLKIVSKFSEKSFTISFFFFVCLFL